MGNPSLRIPIFPLNVVLLPGQTLPLHIFEPRYKLMVGTVMKNGAPFGVVRVREDAIFRVGCTANVVEIVNTYEDGRMDIATMGRTAFRILDIHNDMPYLEATIDPLADNLEPGPAQVTADLRSLFEDCYRLAHRTTPPDISASIENDSEAPFTYQLAAKLPLDLDALQALLEIRDESGRRRRLVEQLTELRTQLVRIAQMRDKTAGNGHGLN